MNLDQNKFPVLALCAFLIFFLGLLFYKMWTHEEGFHSQYARVPCSYQTQKCYGGVSYKGRNSYKDECPSCHSCDDIDQRM